MEEIILEEMTASGKVNLTEIKRPRKKKDVEVDDE